MHSLAELKRISVHCGLASTASKATQIAALKSFYERDVEEFPTHSAPVLSLDLGLRNLAVCQLQAEKGKGGRFRILAWNKYDLNLPEVYNPGVYSQKIRTFCENSLLSNFPGSHIFIERQRHRTGSKFAVLETVIRLAILEAQLHAVLGVSSPQHMKIVSVIPGSVAKYFNLPEGKEKKSAAVQVVKKLIEEERVVFSDSLLLTAFLGERKQDDLADSLLQGVASLEFRRNCRQFIESLRHSDDQIVVLGK